MLMHRNSWRLATIRSLTIEFLASAALGLILGCNSGQTRPSAASSNSNSVDTMSGPRIRPLTDRKFEKTPGRLARGRYLVNGIGECFACHGPSDPNLPGWPPVRGKEGSGFNNFSAETPGLVAANLTPDRETGIG